MQEKPMQTTRISVCETGGPDKAAQRKLEKVSCSFTPEEIEKYQSPYEAVRATVSTQDDPSLPTMTFRFWTLGILFTILLSFINQFFYFRATPLTVTAMITQLLSYPLGTAMARWLPARSIGIGRRLRFSLNPGPFNVKEHVLITVCANAAASTAYAVDIVTIKRVFYRQDPGFFVSLLLVLTTQCFGYGLAGMARRFLVRPSAMIWPAQLVNVTLFRTMHEEEQAVEQRGQMTRLCFFFIAASCSFAYYFLPGYFATFLSTISLLCYFAPNNRLANQLGSGKRGLGVLAFSFDWNYISSYLTSPLVVPFWAQMNIFLGFVLMVYIIVPIGFYSDIWHALRFPIYSSALFTSDGHEYDTLAILNDRLEINQAKYAEQGAPHMAFIFAIAYGFSFASLSAILMHTFLHHGSEIAARFRDARSATDDIHVRLMDRYPQVPDWWYMLVFALNTMLAIIMCWVFDVGLPWWALLLAVAMAATFVVPMAIITAVTNQTPRMNLISQMVLGFILPGRAIANLTFKNYGYIAIVQAIAFLGDLKLGQYMKVPPRHMFIAQTVGTLTSGVVSLTTAYLMYYLIPDICSSEQTVWSCDYSRVFYAASVIWGAIGPNRMFGSEGYYATLNWFFLIGLLLPVPFWLLARRFPDSWFKYVHIPVFLSGTALIPPAKAGMYTSWFLIGFVFQFLVFRYRHTWWNRYNYILSAALDSGIAISGIVIFIAFQYREVLVTWWGTQPDCPTFKVL